MELATLGADSATLLFRYGNNFLTPTVVHVHVYYCIVPNFHGIIFLQIGRTETFCEDKFHRTRMCWIATPVRC